MYINSIILFALFITNIFANDTELISILQNKNIIGIEYVLVDETDAYLESHFGHSLLRLIDDDLIYENDIVVGFEADLSNSKKPIREAIIGKVPINLKMNYFQQFWLYYTVREGRAFRRKIIVSTLEQRENLKKLIIQFISSSTTNDQYSFFKNNCTGALSNLLKKSGFEFDSKDILNLHVPVYFVNAIENSFLSPYPPIKVHSPLQIREKASRCLSLSQGNFEDYNLWPDDANTKLLDCLEIDEISILLDDLWDFPMEKNSDLFDRLKRESLSSNQVYGMQVIPKSLYNICYDSLCAEKQSILLREIWMSENENHKLWYKIFRRKYLKFNPRAFGRDKREVLRSDLNYSYSSHELNFLLLLSVIKECENSTDDDRIECLYEKF